MGNPVVSKKAFGSAKRSKARKNSKHDCPNWTYFRLLGLRSGESRVEVIRDAALAMSIGLGCETHRESSLQQRHEIAVATYRLLDPRRRRRQVERIQLCYPIDRDEAAVPPPHFHVSSAQDRQTLPAAGQAEVVAVLIEGSESANSRVTANHGVQSDLSADDTVPPAPSPERRGVVLMQQPVIDRAIDEVLLAPAAITRQSDSESWMDERREIVRSLKKYDIEESRLATTQTGSTLTWLRSVFGL